MTAYVVIAIVVVVTAIDLLVIWGIIRMGWGPLPSAFPARPAGPDAVSKRFQSFRLGILNLGYCVHVAVDDQCLHLDPARLLRWFGARPASIPWESISLEKRSRIGSWITVKIGRQKLVGPAWCLDLADPKDE